jgi:hypothetical protein
MQLGHFYHDVGFGSTRRQQSACVVDGLQNARRREKESIVRLVVALVALGVCAITSGQALAQTGRSTAAEKAAPKKVVRSVSGSVRTASNDAVVVVGRDKGRETEWTFAVEPTTNIRKGSKSIVAGDLKAGEAVQVRFSERDGKAVAESILVRSAKKEAAGAKK